MAIGVVVAFDEGGVDLVAHRRPGGGKTSAAFRGRPTSRWIKSLGEDDQLVEWYKPTSRPRWIPPEQYEKLPGSMVVREVRRTIRRKGFRPLTVTIVTTLLDPEKYPGDELIALRMQRWEVEVVQRLQSHSEPAMPQGQLTMDERYLITHMHMAGHSPSAIGRRLGRHRGTIGRELARNRDDWGGYHYESAQRLAGERRTRAGQRYADLIPKRNAG